MTAADAIRLGTLDILLVEDNDADALFVSKGLARLKTPTRLHVARNGEEAIQFLDRDGFQERLDVIFLDVNLPGMNGLELLERVKRRVGIARIPVLILTSSTADDDRRRAAELGASEYLVKPPLLPRLFDLLGSVEERWLLGLARRKAE